jgi:hypothetical protein
VPKSENRAISGFVDLFEVNIAFRLPPDGPSDDLDDPIAEPSDEPGFQAI